MAANGLEVSEATTVISADEIRANNAAAQAYNARDYLIKLGIKAVQPDTSVEGTLQDQEHVSRIVDKTP